MTAIRYLCFFVISSLSSSLLFAHLPIGSDGKPLPTVAAAPKAKNRDQCSTAKSQTDIEINNVRARLQGGGDIWWDFKVGRYIVPKPAPGVTPVASFYAGGIWIGGVDAGGNLKTACTTYRTWGNDWFSGPLEFSNGATEARTCANWINTSVFLELISTKQGLPMLLLKRTEMEELMILLFLN